MLDGRWPTEVRAEGTPIGHRPSAVGHPLLVFADDWGRHPSSCQHLISRLLDRREVLWANTIGTRPPRLDLATLRRGAEKLRGWSRKVEPNATATGPRVLDPKMWPWMRSGSDRRLNRTLLLRQLVPVLEALPSPPVVVTTLPIVADLVGRLPAARWVYYCVDDFGQWPGLDGPTLRDLETRLVERADSLIAAGEVLRGRLAALGRSAHLLTHGVDLGHWSSGRGTPPPGLDELPRPLVVFWGLVDRRMDLAFLERLSAELDEGTIVLAGPESDPDPALTRIARVRRLPALPYADLPALAREASVLVMPYADLPVTRAMQPLKLLEYLAAGKPVVVRDLPAARPWADALDLADSPESFARLVRERSARSLPDGQAKARSRLAAEGWDEKARLFEHWVLGD